jgi:hypothetical protein
MFSLAGCGGGKDDKGSGAVAGGPQPGGATGTAAAATAAAAAEDSFFAGGPPPGVTLKATKGFAIGPGVLTFAAPEGWSGGKLPGYDYMGMNKEGTAAVRVMASMGVVDTMKCKDIAVAAAMAPTRAKNLVDVGETTLRKVGKNEFVAREGQCSADGPKGPLVIHFIDIARKDKDGIWHYAALAALPKDAPPAMRSEALAWARSLEFNGESAYKLP